MRAPLDYGDNFPVVRSGSWDSRVPWRFPQLRRKKVSFGSLWEFLPWIMLGIGVTLGAVFGLRFGGVVGAQDVSKIVSHALTHPGVLQPDVMVPRDQPVRPRNRLA